MRRILPILTLLGATCLPAAAQELLLKPYDWLPGDDPELKQRIIAALHLDPSKFPRFHSSNGVSRLENPGGAPATVMSSRVELGAGTYTLRWRWRATEQNGLTRAVAELGAAGMETFLGDTWRSGALTETVPGSVGPQSVKFGLRGNFGALEVSDVELAAVPFAANASVSDGKLHIHLDGVASEGLVARLRSAPLDGWGRLPEQTPREVPLTGANTSIEIAQPPEPGLLSWEIADGHGALVHAGGQLRLSPTPPLPRGPRRRNVDITPDGFCQVDGQRILPLGLYCQPRPDGLALCQSLGLNVAILGEDANTEALGHQAAQLGLELILCKNIPVGQSEQAAALTTRYPDLPVLGWSAVDEPEEKASYAHGLTDIYRAMVSADSRPVFESLHNEARIAPFSVGADIVALDPYPVCSVSRPLMMIATELDQARLLADPGRSFWLINQAFAEAPNWMRPPNDAELRAMSWLAFNHGARGLVYYSQDEILTPGFPNYRWNLANAPIKDEIHREATELTALQSYLLDGRGPLPARSRGSIDAALFPTDSSTLLTVVNLSDRPEDASVEIAPGATVDEYRTRRALTLKDQRLELHLSPYETRLFILSNS